MALHMFFMGLQGLLYYLFTCAEGQGNLTNGIFGIAPPSVDLFSCDCSMALTLSCSCNAAFWDNREASAMAMPSNVLLFFLSSEEVGIFLKDHL
jgi:hypothetical protein